MQQILVNIFDDFAENVATFCKKTENFSKIFEKLNAKSANFEIGAEQKFGNPSGKRMQIL